MKSLHLLWILAASSLVLTHCAAFKSTKPDKKPQEKPAAEAPALVGRIASIPADKRFVLIQSYGSWNIETGTILTTRGPEGRTANLLTTGEKLGQFAAADLQSGEVKVGDAVYSRHVPKPAETVNEAPKSPETPENQQKTEIENVQKNN
ncbi:MAG: hypothetical protein H8M99_05815 [Gloeobacteraceae cyanobacterium ES-bin-144]|nr:hypothetical protein [Verrucomicrobiales bacterium]